MTNRYDEFQSFDSFQDIEDKIKNGLSFSGVVIVLATTIYGVIIRKRNVFDFHAIKFDDDNGFHRSKSWYSRIDLTNTNLLSFRSRNEVIEKAADYILFIPIYSDQKDTDIEYTLISKNWKCRFPNNCLLTFTPLIPSLRKMIESIENMIKAANFNKQ